MHTGLKGVLVFVNQMNRAKGKWLLNQRKAIGGYCFMTPSKHARGLFSNAFQLPLQRFASESRPASQDSPAGFHKVHKQCTAFPFPNSIYFSKNGNPSINTTTSTNMKTYTPHSQQHSGIYFPESSNTAAEQLICSYIAFIHHNIDNTNAYIAISFILRNIFTPCI